jgi:hypothetical protein
LQASIKALEAKNAELLSEKKQFQSKAQKEEEARQNAERDALLKSGDIEAIKKAHQTEIEKARSEFDGLRKSIAEKEISATANQLASSIADGPNAKLLSRFIAERLRHENGSVKVVDSDGNLTINTVDELKAEFSNNPDYASLITGSKASGGGATNQSNASGGGKKTMTRQQFNALDQMNKAQQLELTH